MDFYICESCFESFCFVLVVFIVFELINQLGTLLLQVSWYFSAKTNYFSEKRKTEILSRGESLPEPFFKRLFSRFFKK